MHLYFGKDFKAVASGTVIREITCEQCGCEYHYRLVRRGSGSAHSPYNLNNKGAERRAQMKAERHLQKMLLRDVDPVQCPDCGWFQQGMVREMRRRRHRWLNVVAIVLGVLFGVIVLIWIPTATRGFERSMKESDVAALLVMIGLFLIGVLGPLVLRWLLLRFIQPNRNYPNRPKPVPGAPKAYRKDEVITEDDEDDALLDPGGWATVQLLDFPPAAECCNCGQSFAKARTFKPGELAVVEVGVCDTCWKAYRWTQWYWSIGGMLMAAVAGYLIFRDEKMEEAGRWAICGIAALLGLIPSLVLSTRFAAPVRFSKFDGTRNTVRIRFRNPEFMPVFLERYRRGRIEPAPAGD